LLSPLSYATRNFTSGKSDVYVLVAAARHGFKMVLRPTAAATRGYTTVSFTEAVSRRNTFVGGTCASPNALLVDSTTRSQLLDDRGEDRDGMSETIADLQGSRQRHQQTSGAAAGTTGT